MKYIFCSFMFDDVEKNIRDSKSPNAVSGHKFQINMMNGLVENGCDISVINVPRIRRYPDYRKIIFRKRKFRTEHNINATSVGFINLFGLNYLTQIAALYRELKALVRQNPDEKIVLLVYNTYLAQIIAMRRIRARYSNVMICDVIGDIYGEYGLTSEKTLHGRLVDYAHDRMDAMARECDAFALATEAMADALQIKDKPHIVIEGMYEVVGDRRDNASSDGVKTVFYAGALAEEYGVGHMLRAFALIKDPRYVFLLAGGGDAVDAIKEAARKDDRIKYLGFITPKEVEEYQLKATVLINPRTSEHKYVKYSFASKNLECLASGIPYVAHDLPCNPEEYGNCIIYPKDETDAAFAETIQAACELDREERIRIGERNRTFIETQKNPKTQMKRLDDLLKSL